MGVENCPKISVNVVHDPVLDGRISMLLFYCIPRRIRHFFVVGEREGITAFRLFVGGGLFEGTEF